MINIDLKDIEIIPTSSTSGGEYDDTPLKADISNLQATKADKTELGNYQLKGKNTTASGKNSYAEGFMTRATGENSHAEGFGSEASNRCSHAEGEFTISSNLSSHAEGANTQANGRNSHAEGNCTIANNYAEHASGSCNKSIKGVNQDVPILITDSSATLFSVGNSWDIDDRKNAFEIKWNGDIYFKKDGVDVMLQTIIKDFDTRINKLEHP